MGIFRHSSIAVCIIALSACGSNSIRGKTPITVSTRANESTIIGMYVEQKDWQCAKEPCAAEMRLYNEDFSDFTVVKGEFDQRDIGRVLEAVGTKQVDSFTVRKYRRRSLVNYEEILSIHADQYMANRYGCVLAWDRNFEWNYDSGHNSAVLKVVLNHHSIGDDRKSPRLTIFFDGLSGRFIDERQQNIPSALCQS